MVSGMRILHSYRIHNGNGNSQWRTFPFYYTVLALSEFDIPEVIAELRYVGPALEKVAAGRNSGKEHSLRRKTLAERILRQR